MAIAIKSIPTIESKDAKAFIRKADAKSKKTWYYRFQQASNGMQCHFRKG